jgi:predicted dehydrogenase
VSQPRIVVIGTGSFGRNHLRVVHQSTQAGLSGVFDTDEARAAEAAKNFNCRIFSSLEEATQESDAAIVATPTTTHADIGCRLMERGLDVLVEKPIAHSLEFGERLVETAERCGKILQVGHLERFNPAVLALEKVVTKPMFFEIHRLSEFSPRSLDVDVVLDLMIHDIDIILALSGLMPEEIRAAGISILSEKVDIANVRLQFPGGCIANLTASRVSTERVRKLRLFQPHEYISLDYGRQDAVRFRVERTADASALCAAKNGPPMKIDFAALPIEKDEPLRLELEDFFSVVQTRQKPRSSGRQALAALQVAHGILVKIEEHARLVAEALSPH